MAEKRRKIEPKIDLFLVQFKFDRAVQAHTTHLTINHGPPVNLLVRTT